MNAPNYIEITFNNISIKQSETLIALLNELEFDGFEESENELKAYIVETIFDETSFAEMMKSLELNYTTHTIQSQNWNAVWEAQFEPVLVNDFAGIRAHFHPSFARQVAHEIIITPKMSFGTGHHATTWMMMEQMQHIDFKNKQVLDFGTGTGILAILSEKLGATHVLAIDIDEWSIENAKENIERNNCIAINVQQADSVATDLKYDVIVANINKDVILRNIKQLSDCLNGEGHLLLSGLLAEDEQDILAATSSSKLKHRHTVHRGQWIAMHFAS